jgi:hypothetical protein
MIGWLFSPIGRRVVAAVAVGFALCVVAWWLMDKGADRAVEKINRQNTKAENVAAKTRAACDASPAACVRDEWTRDGDK